jgi:endoglucanase
MFPKTAICCLLIIGSFAAENLDERVSRWIGAWQTAAFRNWPQIAEAIDGKTVPMRIANADMRPDGVRLTTAWLAPTINQGDTVVHILDVKNAVAGQKIRIQNSNHGAVYFATDFSAAVRAAIATLPGITYTLATAQQVEITLTAGTYTIPITQTVSVQNIPGTVDDAPWAPGTQLQVDWILSSAPSNGAPVESGYMVESRWITHAQQGPVSNQSSAKGVPRQSVSTDARWSLLRSVPNIRTGDTVTFEIDKTNYPLTSSTKIQVVVNGASTANDLDFVAPLNESIVAGLNENVSFEPQTGTLTFGPKAVFPFTFKMTAGVGGANKDYILEIRSSEVGQIDVAQAGIRLGNPSMPAMKALIGINEASGEFGVGNYNFKYSYPGKDRIGWVAAQGFGIIRVPFVFQNIQASSGTKLNEAAMRQLDPVLGECAAQRIVCLLDMHNYGMYYLDESATSQGQPGSIGTSNARLANLWAQIASRYKDNTYVWFDLMNEPNKQTALEWVNTANAITAAIRAAGATNKIVFQGTAWEGAWTWTSSGNAKQMLKAYDPGNNYAFEAHQYLDLDGSGTSPTCVAGSGAARLEPFTSWLQKYDLHGIIGEVGWAANTGCTIEATALLHHWQTATTSTSAGGYIGLTYWAAGPWWPDGYMYLAEPRPFPNGPDPPQLVALKAFVPHH